MVFLLAGFVQYMYIYGAILPAAILLIAILIGGMYFVGWLSIFTVLLGMVYVNVKHIRGHI